MMFNFSDIVRRYSYYLALAMCTLSIMFQFGPGARWTFRCFVMAIFCFAVFLILDKFAALRKVDKRYLMAFVGLAVCLVPSVLFSGNIRSSFFMAYNMIFYWPLVFGIILVLRPGDKVLFMMLVPVSIVFGADCLCSFMDVVQGVTSRSKGFDSGVLLLASNASYFFPMYYVLFLSDLFKPQKRFLLMLGVLACVLAMYGTKSRAGWLIVIFSIIFYGFLSCKRDRKKMAFVVTILALFTLPFFLSSSLRARFISSFDLKTNASNVARITLYNKSYELFKLRPLTGIGLGEWDYESFVKGGIIIDGKQIDLLFPHAHNNEMHLLAEGGILAFVGYIFFMLYLGRVLYRKDFLENHFRIAVLAVLINLNLFGQIENNIFIPDSMRIFWFLMGCLTVLADNYKKDNNGLMLTDGKEQ